MTLGDRLGRQVANPTSLSATPVTYRTRAPRLGEHSAEIRSSLHLRDSLAGQFGGDVARVGKRFPDELD